MEELLQNEYIIYLINTVAYLLNAFVLFLIGKVSYQLFHPKIQVKNELVEKDNLAFAIAHAGYFTGILLAVGSAIIGPSHGLWQDLFDISTYGLMAIVLLNFSTIVTDKILLRHFSVRKEIVDDRNAGTGVVEAANAIASGLVLMGAVTGENHTGMSGYVTALIFWAIGQAAVIFIAWVYNLITSYSIHKEIEKDNVAVGVGFAGAIIAIANLVRYALAGDFESWSVTFSDVGFEIVLGLILLPVVRFLTDKILLPGQKLTDELVNQEKANIGAGLIEAFAYIGGSVLITWCL
ncbi:DUF350 domain-containing protein [Salinivirga cyanobacteriivorans]